MAFYAVPLMLFASSLLMAFAWLGHIRYRHKGFIFALLSSWFIVLPEYLLNISAILWVYGTYQPIEMAARNLSSCFICVAIVAKIFLGEHRCRRQISGFFLMGIGVMLVVL